MKYIILASILMILSCTSINAMTPSKKTELKNILPEKGKVPFAALKAFPDFWDQKFFDANINKSTVPGVRQRPRMRYAKAYLTFITMMLESVPGSTLDDLPTTDSGVDLSAQAKKVLKDWQLTLVPVKASTGEDIYLVQPEGAAPSAAEVTKLQAEVANLKTQLAAAKAGGAPTGPEPANLDEAIKQATTAAKAVREAYTTYTGADKDRIAKPGIQGISAALVTPKL